MEQKTARVDFIDELEREMNSADVTEKQTKMEWDKL